MRKSGFGNIYLLNNHYFYIIGFIVLSVMVYYLYTKEFFGAYPSADCGTVDKWRKRAKLCGRSEDNIDATTKNWIRTNKPGTFKTINGKTYYDGTEICSTNSCVVPCPPGKKADMGWGGKLQLCV